jgi:hypothetical protein
VAFARLLDGQNRRALDTQVEYPSMNSMQMVLRYSHRLGEPPPPGTRVPVHEPCDQVSDVEVIQKDRLIKDYRQ